MGKNLWICLNCLIGCPWRREGATVRCTCCGHLGPVQSSSASLSVHACFLPWLGEAAKCGACGRKATQRRGGGNWQLKSARPPGQQPWAGIGAHLTRAGSSSRRPPRVACVSHQQGSAPGGKNRSSVETEPNTGRVGGLEGWASGETRASLAGSWIGHGRKIKGWARYSDVPPFIAKRGYPGGRGVKSSGGVVAGAVAHAHSWVR